MFCPRCASNQDDDLKFCKACGANLFAVRQVMDQRHTDEKFNWNKTWVAEMLQSSEEAVRRQRALEIASGTNPEINRYNEIKGGVITSSVGLALMIFLHVFMQGIIIGGKIPNDTAEILSRVWLAGIIPFFIGLAIIFNGVFLSKKIVELSKKTSRSTAELGDPKPEVAALRPADTTQFMPAKFSVTEDTTKHLSRTDDSQ